MTESEENVERTGAAEGQESSESPESTAGIAGTGERPDAEEAAEPVVAEPVAETDEVGQAGEVGETGETEGVGEETAEPVSPEERRRRILVDVAAGTLDPTEASWLLDELGAATGAEAGDAADAAGTGDEEDGAAHDEGGDPWSAATDEVPTSRHGGKSTTERPVTAGARRNGSGSRGSSGLSGSSGSTGTAGSEDTSWRADVPPTRLRIRTMGRRVRVIGEPFVKTVSIDGPHVVRTEDDTLVVTSEGEIGASVDGFTLLRTRSLRDVQEQVFDFGRELSVRVNPNLIVEVEVTAGSLNAERLPSLEHVRITAGSGRLRDVSGPIDLLVQAGSATIEGALARGTSRLRAESGSLQLHLMPGSDVSIRSDAQLGRIGWDRDTGEKERVFGDGTAHLDLEVMMGNIQVKEA